MRTIHVHIEFPALDALVEYLKAKDNQQAEIDSLTAKVTHLAETLSQSTRSLKDSIESK